MISVFALILHSNTSHPLFQVTWVPKIYGLRKKGSSHGFDKLALSSLEKKHNLEYKGHWIFFLYATYPLVSEECTQGDAA